MHAKRHDDDDAYVRIWNDYIDDLKAIFADFYLAAMHLVAAMNGPLQERARPWVPSYLVLKRLVPDNPIRWQNVQYVPKTQGMTPTGALLGSVSL